MTLPTLFESDAAGIAAIAGVVVAALWKLRLWMRHDTRTDRAAETTHAAYDDLVDTLRLEVARLSILVEAMGTRLDEETLKRHTAEAEVYRLKLRVQELERFKEGRDG